MKILPCNVKDNLCNKYLKSTNYSQASHLRKLFKFTFSITQKQIYDLFMRLHMLPKTIHWKVRMDILFLIQAITCRFKSVDYNKVPTLCHYELLFWY